MDQITPQGLPPVDNDRDASRPAASPAALEGRELQEWELVLAGGGEGVPCWG